MIQRYVRRAIALWEQWRFDKTRTNRSRSLRRAVPALVALDTRQAVLRSQHRSGAKALASERKRLVTERLRSELGLAS